MIWHSFVYIFIYKTIVYVCIDAQPALSSGYTMLSFTVCVCVYDVQCTYHSFYADTQFVPFVFGSILLWCWRFTSILLVELYLHRLWVPTTNILQNDWVNVYVCIVYWCTLYSSIRKKAIQPFNITIHKIMHECDWTAAIQHARTHITQVPLHILINVWQEKKKT